MLGAIAFVVFAVVVTVLLLRWGVLATAAIALVVWVAVAVSLYALVMAVFHGEPSPP